MATFPPFFLFLSLLTPFAFQSSAVIPRRRLHAPQQAIHLKYHNGTLLKGMYVVNLLFYGSFTPAQRAIVADFVRSFSARPAAAGPSIASWWATTSLYAHGGATRLALGRVILDETCSLGKSLNNSDIRMLAASGGPHRTAITAVLTAAEVLVDGFCRGRCGYHGNARPGGHGKARYPYLWVGNPATQCLGECAWPFAKPTYGPKSPPLVPPNGDAAIDGMVISLATLLVDTVTNPYGNGYFQGPAKMLVEAATACTGMFGTGAFPEYPGKLLVDSNTGASYNARGAAGKGYLVPAIWDPSTKQCKPPV